MSEKMLLHDEGQVSQEIMELTQKIREIILPHPEILLAYLYGSIIEGPFTSRSDIDIGLYLTQTGLEDRWYPIRIQNELEEYLKTTHVINKPDIRVINRAYVKFQYSVIFRNPRILVRDEQVRIAFEHKVLLDWYAIRPTWERFYREREEVLKNND